MLREHVRAASRAVLIGMLRAVLRALSRVYALCLFRRSAVVALSLFLFQSKKIVVYIGENGPLYLAPSAGWRSMVPLCVFFSSLSELCQCAGCIWASCSQLYPCIRLIGVVGRAKMTGDVGGSVLSLSNGERGSVFALRDALEVLFLRLIMLRPLNRGAPRGVDFGWRAWRRRSKVAAFYAI